MVRRPAGLVLIAAVLCAAPARILALELDRLDIKPGPVVMSEEEKALAPDPAPGSQHGIVLLEETERHDNAERGYAMQVSYHMRAKIFSNAGRDLADVVIPFNRQEGKLLGWWGRVLVPDGTVHEVPQADLVETTELEIPGRSYRVLKAVLPMAAPGCVIDYGYAFEQRGYYRWIRARLQTHWPVRNLRYRWVPNSILMTSYAQERTEGLDVKVTRESRALLATAKDLPAILAEPFMPPQEEVGALIYFSSTNDGLTAGEYWNSQAKEIDRQARDFFPSNGALRDLIATMGIPPEGQVLPRVRHAYDWIQAHLRDSSAGRREKLTDQVEESRAPAKTIREILRDGEGTATELAQLFTGVARALGASAYVVLATDRRERYWSEALLTLDQFSMPLVMVWEPGRPEDKETVVAPGSGLPFGEIPWWVTGVRGFLANPEKVRPIMLAPAPARRNVGETKVSITFPDQGGGSPTARWTNSGTGQQGYLEARTLRSLGLEERKSRLPEMCGAGPRLDVTKAEAAGVDDPGAGFKLECEGEIQQPGPSVVIADFTVRLDQGWMKPVPDLPAAERIHPVIFEYPRTDILSLDISAPKGFVTIPPPPRLSFDSPYGRYLLSVTANDGGYHVERVFTLTPLGVPAREYDPLRSFLADVGRADRTPLEFKRSVESR